ncbi:MAG: AmmeMemoRadiSam system protein A [Pseudomonadota bacterium]|nr:AmmeMemoRadiSam system protein A [Pseudomonadota bacterium]
MRLSAADQQRLIELAWASIRHGLAQGGPLATLEPLSPALREPGASFVTLELDGALRGCIGSLQAHRPLAEDVAHNAYAAAFHDSRFTPLQQQELTALGLQVSVLSPAEEIQCKDEADLLRQLKPGEDGIILEEGVHRATFLPQVWDQLPSPAAFLAHLKNKAGLPQDYWSNRLRIQRYRVEKFG